MEVVMLEFLVIFVIGMILLAVVPATLPAGGLIILLYIFLRKGDSNDKKSGN